MYAYTTPGTYFEWLDERAAPAFARLDVASFVGFAERGPLHRPVRIESFSQFVAVFGQHVPYAYLAYAVEGFFDNGGDACWIVRVDDPARAQRARLSIEYRRQRLQLVATSEGAWGNRLRVRALSGRTKDDVTLHVSSPDGLTQIIVAPFDRMKQQRERLDRPQALDEDQDRLDADVTLLVSVVADAEPAKTLHLPSDGAELLAGGVDGLATVTAAHFAGDDRTPEQPFGWRTLEPIEEIGLVAAPDLMPQPSAATSHPQPRPRSCDDLGAIEGPPWEPPAPLAPARFEPNDVLLLQNELIAHCRRAGYRTAVLDAPLDATPDAMPAVRGGFGRSGDVAALYHPWLLVRDPLELTGVVRAIPPSGHVAGVYARVDRTQGVHEAPANEVVEAVAGVTQRIDDAWHGALNAIGVNVIRVFGGGGIRVAGARTLFQDPLLRYVSVRRLLFLIEKSIERDTQWIAFEPNHDATRRETDRVVRALVARLFGRGMLDGTSAADAFFVRCDATNNPPESIERGQLVCEVGVRPPWPAEFVVVRITKTHSGTEVQEEEGAVNG